MEISSSSSLRTAISQWCSDPESAMATYGNPVGSWDVSRLTQIFLRNIDGCSNAINIDLSNWDTSRVTFLSQGFHDLSRFNGDISGWDVSKVNNLQATFEHASQFNGDISSWDISRSTNLVQSMYHDVVHISCTLQDSSPCKFDQP